MAATRCPQCDLPLTRDEWKGGFCPACRGGLSSPVIRGRAFDDDNDLREPDIRRRGYDDDDFERPSYGYSRSHGRGRGSWATARAGLLTMLISFSAILGFYLLTILVLVVSRDPFAGRGPSENVFALVGCMILLLAIVYTVGVGLCLGAPEGRGWIVAAFICLAGAGVLVGIMTFLMVVNQRGPQHWDPYVVLVVGGLIQLLLVGSQCCVVCFLRVVGETFSNRFLVIAGNVFLIAFLVTCIFVATIVVVQSMDRGFAHAKMLAVFALIVAVVMIALAFLKIALMVSARITMDSR